jgi:hypothetical protein
MKAAWIGLVVAACEFQPAPPPAPASPPPPPPAPVVVADAGDATAPPADAAAIQVTDDCLRTSTHVAELLIAGAPDPALRASYETERAGIVRRTAEVCTTQGWSAELQRCFGDAKLQIDIEACRNKFPPPKK